MKALVADNDPDILEIIKMTLTKKANFEVEEAVDGEEVMSKLCKNPKEYDLLVLDIMMPNKSGIDVCKELVKKKEFSKLPVILVSALPVTSDTFQSSLKQFRELSVVKGVIEKPFGIEDFLKKIDKVLS